jgi:hypothetical protein
MMSLMPCRDWQPQPRLTLPPVFFKAVSIALLLTVPAVASGPVFEGGGWSTNSPVQVQREKDAAEVQQRCEALRMGMIRHLESRHPGTGPIILPSQPLPIPSMLIPTDPRFNCAHLDDHTA